AASSKKLALEVVAGDESVHCFGDRVRVEQIIWNLLSNAAKFTPNGGRIEVRFESDDEFARVTVSDTGCGIAPEYLPHVFGMFNQGDENTASRNGGLGIGLALVEELTRAHGGRVEVQSEGIDRGARFSVWLPLLGRDTPPAPERPTQVVDFKGWRILAVDDYAEGLLPFAEVLRLEGATVDIAESARKALELLDTNVYDLLVSDLGMPEMDGYALISEVRRRPAIAELPAIAMSGFGRRADARRALESGFNAHVPKPAAIEELKAAVGRL
ncbi:MAG: response regulator, partial [Hyphomicrobiales bacterium]